MTSIPTINHALSMRKLTEIFRMIKDVNFSLVFGFINISNASFHEFVKTLISSTLLRSSLFSIEIMDTKTNKTEDFTRYFHR